MACQKEEEVKICVYGAGAVGGFIATRLSRPSNELSIVEVGAVLDAIRNHGLRVKTQEGIVTAKVHATDDPFTLGTQDIVVIAVKSPALRQIAGRISTLIGPDTTVLPAMNGVQWWFFDGFGGQLSGTRLESVDPNGDIALSIPSKHVVGCVVHGSFAVIEPGFVHHVSGKKLIIGELDGSDSSRVRALAALLSDTGLEVDISQNIHSAVWFKLWGNMTMNPLSAVTGATCDRILDDPLVNRFCIDVMAEAARIGARIGCPIAQTGEERNTMTRRLGAFKTSMLQDVEAKRPVELDALVGVVREIGQKLGESTPNLDALLGLARLHARVRGLYPW